HARRGLELAKHGRQRILPEGRIEENHVERLRFPQIRKCIVEHELSRARADGFLGFAKTFENRAVLLDHDHARRAARGGLEAERAAAGEQIEARQPVERLAEPVEQRLAHAVGRRPQIGTIGHLDFPAAVFTADDPNFSFVRMHRSMVATSWAARLKAGLARTRDVLNTPVSELFTRGKIDEALYEELEATLLQADCGVGAAHALVEEVRRKEPADGAALKGALRDAIAGLLSPLERTIDLGKARPLVIMIAGVNGSGKTTSIGELAKWLQGQGKSVMLAAGDTFRAAAREQLVVWGARNNVPVVAQESGDPGAVVFDALNAARARKIDLL